MRRLIAIFALLVAVPVVLVFGTGANNGGGGTYRVRAIFDFVRAVPGEDVKVAGAKVGSIESLDVTPDNKAAVVLDIQKDGFSPFHQDAQCTVRPQSLIGETFVECSPGSNRTPELKKIQRGDGKGQHLLPVSNTSSPVDIDEINDIMREPIRQRLAILINEFGGALAGRGQDLNAAIRRANPALRDTDKVLAILASENRTLADLAKNSDQVLAPLAARRQQVADFIVQANRTGQATAERRADISAGIHRFPAFLRQLQPTLADLGALADQFTPVVTNLHAAAPGLNRFFEQLGPFSRASIPALTSLGQAADVGRPALITAKPIVTDLATFSKAAQPVSKNLDALQKSLGQTGAVNKLMDYIFYTMNAINGFDGVGHYLRAALIVNLCSTYTTTVTAGCSANFSGGAGAATASSANGKRLAKLVKAERAGKLSVQPPTSSPGTALQRFLQFTQQPNVKAQRRAAIKNTQALANRGESPAFGQQDPALQYLLGP